jgi:predicted HNH restriction endonuclease
VRDGEKMKIERIEGEQGKYHGFSDLENDCNIRFEDKQYLLKNIKVIDKVGIDDKIWFEKNPEEIWRFRNFITGESIENGSDFVLVRKISDECRTRIPIKLSDNVLLHINIMENAVKKFEDERIKKQEEEINTDISELKGETNEYVKTKIIEKFKRDYKLVKDLKQKYNECQLCKFTFKKKNGENYNETHHIIQLSDGGKDAEINTLVVCANCHRKLHYADVDITNVLKGEIKINGEVIKWK